MYSGKVLKKHFVYFNYNYKLVLSVKAAKYFTQNFALKIKADSKKTAITVIRH